jgi:uncharacterized membrane protein
MDAYDSDKILPLTTVTKLGLKSNKAATVAYIPLFPINIIAPAVWLITEPKNNHFVRFHSTQSLVLGVGYGLVAMSLGVVSIGCFFIPILGHIMIGLLGLVGWVALLGYLIGSGFLMYASYNNRLVKLPVVGDIADRVLARIDSL